MGTGKNYRCGHFEKQIRLFCFRYRLSPRQKYGICLSEKTVAVAAEYFGLSKQGGNL